MRDGKSNYVKATRFEIDDIHFFFVVLGVRQNIQKKIFKRIGTVIRAETDAIHIFSDLLTQKILHFFHTPAHHRLIVCIIIYVCVRKNAKDDEEVDDELNSSSSSSRNGNDDDVLSTKFEQYVARVILDFTECRNK